MIKINLLPANLFEGKVLRNIGIVFAVLAIAIVVGVFMWKGQIEAKTLDTKTQADEAQRLTELAEKYTSDAAAQRSSIAPITQKVQFFGSVYQHNQAYVDLYTELSRWTYRRVAYSQVTLTPEGAMTLQANAPNMRDFGRYLINMYEARSLFKSVVVSAAPTLSSGTGSQPGQGGPSGAAPPSYPAGPMGPGMPSAPAPGMASPEAPTTATAGMGAIAMSETKRAAAAKRRFTFTMNCTLADAWKTKLSPPAPPGGAASSTTGMPGAPGGTGVGFTN